MDKIKEIIAWKRQEIASRLRPVRERELSRLTERERTGPTFTQALAHPDRLSVIAEIKRCSPSAGAIAPSIDATEQARRYYNAEVDAISVLTDEKYFSGSLRDLWEVNDFLGIRDDATPTLRKDFMLHPIQVVEAAEANARAILIIIRAFTDESTGRDTAHLRDPEASSLKALYEAANLAGLDSLFEIHKESELEIALDMGAKIIGVNNRDLAHFTTDLTISERLIPQIPEEIVTVSESGITVLSETRRARQAGADAVLIGEALMRTEDPERFIQAIHSL